MNMKPILFNTDMVRAILDNRKTVTRRVVKPQPEKSPIHIPDEEYWLACFTGSNECRAIKPPYQPGEILYARETWCPLDADHVIDGVRYAYKAGATPESERVRKDYGYKWRPSIHMPREAARIFLRVMDVRVERLQDITEEQAKKEAAEPAFEYSTPEGPVIVFDEDGYYDLGFKALWDSTIKPAGRALCGWAANPWVWVIEFERISKKEAGPWKK